MKISNSLKVAAILTLFIGFGMTPDAFAGGDDAQEVKGTVQSLPSGSLIGDWRVANRTVHVTSATRIDQEHGQAAVGAFVEAKGTPQSDGSLTASSVEVKTGASGGSGGGSGGGGDDRAAMEFKGTIETFPAGFIGDWRVGGRIIHVASATRIEQELGPVAVGAFVEIKGAVLDDGTMNATKIEVKSNVAGNDGRDELKGVIESLPGSGLIGVWQVSGRTVRVSSTTVINLEHGQAVIGAAVEVHGLAQSDSSIDASRIEVQAAAGGGAGGSDSSSSTGEAVGFKGTIEVMPGGLIGDWLISGRTVHVTSTAQLKSEHGSFAVGVRVKVKGVARTDGSVDARKIQVRDSF